MTETKVCTSFAAEVQAWAEQWRQRQGAAYATATAARFERAAAAIEDLERRLAETEATLGRTAALNAAWGKRAFDLGKALEFYAAPDHWTGDPATFLLAKQRDGDSGHSVATRALAAPVAVAASMPAAGRRDDDDEVAALPGDMVPKIETDDDGADCGGYVEYVDTGGVTHEYVVINDYRISGGWLPDGRAVMMLDFSTVEGKRRMALAGWAVPHFQDQLKTSAEMTALKIGGGGTA
jgi:hypothetical protein